VDRCDGHRAWVGGPEVQHGGFPAHGYRLLEPYVGSATRMKVMDHFYIGRISIGPAICHEDDAKS
jgi:hypothetical protein